MRAFTTGLLLVGFGLALPASAQPPAPHARPMPAPLLYVRLSGPPGMQASVYQGAPEARQFPAPLRIGVRPGYIYRLKLSGFPNRPGLAVYPTLEVRGTLWSSGKLNPADYPAPVTLGEDDVARVLAGSVLTRVIVLEDPDHAIPEPSASDHLIEFDVPPGADPLAEARGRGRPVLIVRVGEREFSEEEMARQSTAGTVLMPGEKALGPPGAPPNLPPVSRMFFDPVLGPRLPHEECLYDGGDQGVPAGIGPDGQAAGVDPADTVAAYSDAHGRHLAISNRVCVCVPRFIVLRAETRLERYENIVGPGQANGLESYARLNFRVPARLTAQAEELAGLRSRTRASATVTTERLERLERIEVLIGRHIDIGPAVALGTESVRRLSAGERTRLLRQQEFARILLPPAQGPQEAEQIHGGPRVVGLVAGLKVVANVEQPRDFTVSCEHDVRLPARPLVLYKWADRQSAHVGDVVTFYLKYSSQGGRPIGDVAVSDSLTGRLEYIPGTAQSDRDAVFTTQANEAGSLILHWEIRGPLPPGQSGVVRFQARIR